MKQRAFTLDRCSVRSPHVVAGNWVAYFSEVGGAPRGRWLRALVLRVIPPWHPKWEPTVHALDEEDDPVILNRWEKVSTPPALKPDVLRSWLRAMAYYVSAQGELF